MKGRSALIALAGAQFVMVLDQTVMGVSISQLVADFDTTVTTIQAIITLYCLVMAMLMLAGGKIGDIIGRRRAFKIGLVIYGCGSAMTALAPTVAILTLGWSILEGIGASLVLPAMVALIAGNFEGRDRKVAYAVIGGVAGAGYRRRSDRRGLGHHGAQLAGRLRRRGRPRDRDLRHDPVRRRRPPERAQTSARHRRCGPVCRRSRADRPGDPPIQCLGPDPAEGRADRAVRPRSDPLRDRCRRGRAVGVRRLAAAPRGDRERPAGPPRPAQDPAAPIRPRSVSSRRTSS